MKHSFKFFSNTDCEYFPCHTVRDHSTFNCKYCYCPLYLLDCKGKYSMNKGIKDCSNCIIPHTPNADEYVNRVLREQVFNKS